MALVMLPSDLPWWDSVKKQLKKIAQTKNTMELINGMQKIYEMCNVSLDPDDDTSDPDHFVGFLNFLDNDLTSEERCNFLYKTLPSLVANALKLKELKPRGGLHFSLQQQADCTELEYSFVISLLANAFFSTFPKRTDKSHPTLQNFNFADFFKTLIENNTQKAKLRSFLYYFDWIDNKDNYNGRLRILRQVMSSKEWLTIEDWLECTLPLCSLKLKHDGRLDTSGAENLQICFASSKIGGNVLGNGGNQESINLVTIPELMAVLLNVEALEDNEVLTVENVRQISRIRDPKQRATLEKLETHRDISVCFVDAEDYTKLPIGQYEEDNILRELNKCLLAFQQKQWKIAELTQATAHQNFISRHRRLSPIGESVGSNKSESANPNTPMITQQSCSTMSTRSDSLISETNENCNENRLRVKLEMERNLKKMGSQTDIDSSFLVNNRKGRFIVLGSSGECLPVSRKPLLEQGSQYSSCDESGDEEFLSACTSLDDGSDDENDHKKYSSDLETQELRQTFAERLRDALKREKEYGDTSASTSQESSDAMDIRVAGSGVNDPDIKVRRCPSIGFALKEDSIDEEFLQNSLQQEKRWVDKFRSKQSARSRMDSNKSSDCSVSTEYSSELEEVYEQFSRWLDNPILETEKGTKKELDARDLAVVQFAGSLLKRTLSESFAGVPVPLTESGESTSGNFEDFSTKKSRLVLNAKSLSLELARQKHRLAAQLSAAIESPVEMASSLPLTNDISNSVACNQANVTENRRVWFLTCVNEAIIQTLEDVCYCINMPKDEQLSQISRKAFSNGLKPIASGNWGCGSSRKGDVQLKVIIQWLAASVAGVPYLLYYSCGHQQLTKLDTVCRILIDRKWTVKDLVEAMLRYSSQVLRGKELSGTLFEHLIRIDKTAV